MLIKREDGRYYWTCERCGRCSRPTAYATMPGTWASLLYLPGRGSLQGLCPGCTKELRAWLRAGKEKVGE